MAHQAFSALLAASDTSLGAIGGTAEVTGGERLIDGGEGQLRAVRETLAPGLSGCLTRFARTALLAA